MPAGGGGGVGATALAAAGVAVVLGGVVAAGVGIRVGAMLGPTLGATVGVVPAAGEAPAAGVRRPATCVATLPSGLEGAVAGAGLVAVDPAGGVRSFVVPPHAARMAEAVPAAMPPRKVRRLSVVFMVSS